MQTIIKILEEVQQEIASPYMATYLESELHPAKPARQQLPSRFLHGLTVFHGMPGNVKNHQREGWWLISQRDKMVVMLEELIRTGRCNITQHDMESANWLRALRDLCHMVCHNSAIFTYNKTHSMYVTWKMEEHGHQHRTLSVSLSWRIPSKINLPHVQKMGCACLDYWADAIPLTTRMLEISSLGYGVEVE